MSACFYLLLLLSLFRAEASPIEDCSVLSTTANVYNLASLRSSTQDFVATDEYSTDFFYYNPCGIVNFPNAECQTQKSKFCAFFNNTQPPAVVSVAGGPTGTSLLTGSTLDSLTITYTPNTTGLYCQGVVSFSCSQQAGRGFVNGNVRSINNYYDSDNFMCMFVMNIVSQAACGQPNPCATNPCLNKGACSPVLLTTSPDSYNYSCTCPTGYSGNQCQIDRSSVCVTAAVPPCQNGGTCIPVTGQTESFTCQCSSMYSGDTCSIQTNANNGDNSNGNSKFTALFVWIAILSVLVLGLSIVVCVLYKKLNAPRDTNAAYHEMNNA